MPVEKQELREMAGSAPVARRYPASRRSSEAVEGADSPSMDQRIG